MNRPSLIERITRSLAYMLRHRPDEFDLELDRYGAADLNEIVQALNERLGQPIEEADVLEAISSGGRSRYELRDGRIRALYGHSIDVDPGPATRPPDMLYIGLGSRDAERAERYGLRGGRRRFLHLAKTEEEAAEMGRRSAEEYVVITVHALDAWEQDVNFYDRSSLVLAEPIPTDFLTIGEVHTDGDPPQERAEGGRSRSGPRRGGREREERGPRRGRDRDRDRDHDRGRGRDGDRDRGRERPRERREEPAHAERGGFGGGLRERERERGPRRDEGERGRGRGRSREERGGRERDRERREPRAPQPQRPEPTKEIPAAPAAGARPIPATSSFGMGVFDPPSDSGDEPRKERRPAAAAKETPRPPARPEPTPEPSTKDEGGGGSGFGAGV